MIIEFLRAFGGRETREIHYTSGDVVDLDDEIASDLIARCITKRVEELPAFPVAEHLPPPVVITKRARRKA
jgi:hypothetical protein